MADYAGKRQPQVVLAILRTTVVIQLVVTAIIVGGAEVWVWSLLPAEDRVFASIAVLTIFPTALMGLATSMNSTMEKLAANAIPSLAGGLTLALAVVATLVMDWGLVGLASAQLAGRVVDTGLRFVLVKRRLPSYLSTIGSTEDPPRTSAVLPPGLVRQLAGFCAEQTVLLILTVIVWNRSEMFFLKRFCDIRQVAFYSVAFGFGLLPAQLVGPFTNAAKASLFVEQGRGLEGGRHFTEQYWRYTALVVLPASFGLAALSGPLVRVLYGAQYHAAVPVLAVAAALSLVAPLGNPPTLLATAAGGQGLLVRYGLIAAAATIGLDLWLVKSSCAVGGALANGLGQAVSTVSVWIIVHRRFGLRLPGAFTLRLVLAAVGMGALVAGFARLVPDVIALASGPILGAAAYAWLLRAARVLGAEDVDRLLAVGSLLPARSQPLYRKLVRSIAVHQPPS
jgi:O-antigen/teichoic acid export membrane protein